MSDNTNTETTAPAGGTPNDDVKQFESILEPAADATGFVAIDEKTGEFVNPNAPEKEPYVDPREIDESDEDEDDTPAVDPDTVANAENLTPEERRREARKIERRNRKENRRRKEQEREEALTRLNTANIQLSARLYLQEAGTAYQGLQQLKSVQTAIANRIALAKDALSEAAKSSPEDVGAITAQLTDLQSREREVNQRVEAAENGLREKYPAAHLERAKAVSAGAAPATAPETVPAVDPTVKSLTDAWANRNSWFNRKDPLADEDSAIAYALDQQLTKSNRLQPNTPEYWAELDRRIARALPHRAASGARQQRSNGGTPNAQQQTARRTPLTMTNEADTSAAGADGTPRGAFRLSPERVQAMKDSGMWDDPKDRARMIQNYRKYDAEQAARQRR